MGQTYVYNTGDPEEVLEELVVSFGVFIDGTLNNKTNKEMRDKHSRTNEYGTVDRDLTNDQIEEKDTAAYEKISKKDRNRIEKLVSAENRTSAEEAELNAFSERDRYLVSSHRSWMDRKGTGNSYGNDYTNVARMWTCCDDLYKIYVEGMGTDDKVRDSQDGFAFGSGRTGVRSRVRLGCEKLAEKIIDEKIKKENSKKILTTIIVDVSGFSRGAASARNFVYEINRKGAYKPKNEKLLDDDGIKFDESVLIEGMLPKHGHLGYCLAKSDKFTPEELNNLKIIVRFLGIYETVSSYFEREGRIGMYNKDGKIIDDNQIAKIAIQAVSNQFLDDVAELHLNDFGYVQKIVHFTAQNEHRENFDLTRMPGANVVTRIVEKNFPGVHCDIGGAYENEDEVKEQLETSYFVNIDKRKQQLVSEYWFKDGELTVDVNVVSFILGPLGFLLKKLIPGIRALRGTRKDLKKEYSYIPLHFMEEYAIKTPMKDYISSKTEEKYPIDSDEFLIDVRKHLHKYAFDDTGEISSWEFETDDEVALKKAIKEAEKERKKQELSEPLYNMEGNMGDDSNTKPLSEYVDEYNLQTAPPPVEEAKDAIPLEPVVIRNFNSQDGLRRLRSEYLHWSASRKWFGMEPNKERERREHLS